MGWTEIKKELKSYDKERLVGMLAELYKNNKAVREYLDFYMQPDESALFEKYRQKVVEAFYPKRGFELRMIEGKRAISGFKKLGAGTRFVVDLMLVYVETGVRFTLELGDIDEPFYASLESTYKSALTLAQKEELLASFSGRAQKIVEDTNGIGWGFHDMLCEIHGDFYP